MPFWIALFLSAILQPITRLLAENWDQKERIINDRTILFYLLFCILIFGGRSYNLFGDLFLNLHCKCFIVALDKISLAPLSGCSPLFY